MSVDEGPWLEGVLWNLLVMVRACLVREMDFEKAEDHQKNT